MEKIEYRTKDKSKWPRGPWDDEPDKVQWQDEATGLPCLIVRSPVGALCGYVGVPPDHPWHGKEYDDEALIGVEVHGGLSFAAFCQPGPENQSICHKEEICTCDTDNGATSLHGRNHRRRGLDQPRDPHDQNDEIWPPRDGAEAACSSVQHGQPRTPQSNAATERDEQAATCVVCGLPLVERPIYWFGFDCAHYHDLTPRDPSLGDGDYRDRAYVEDQCRALAVQLTGVVH